MITIIVGSYLIPSSWGLLQLPQTLCHVSVSRVRCNFWGYLVDRPQFCWAQGLTAVLIFTKSPWMPWILPCCAMAPWHSKRPLFWSSSFCWSPSFGRRPSAPFAPGPWVLGSPSTTSRSKAGGGARAEIAPAQNSMRCDACGLEGWWPSSLSSPCFAWSCMRPVHRTRTISLILWWPLLGCSSFHSLASSIQATKMFGTWQWCWAWMPPFWSKYQK